MIKLNVKDLVDTLYTIIFYLLILIDFASEIIFRGFIDLFKWKKNCLIVLYLGQENISFFSLVFSFSFISHTISRVMFPNL